MFLDNSNKYEVKKLLDFVVDLGLDFKLKDKVIEKRASHEEMLDTFLKPLSEKWEKIEDIISYFQEKVLPYCTNFSTPYFMWFPDAGNSVSGLIWSVLSDFLQQNLINQSFCSPVATFIEIATISWLRSIVGYKNWKINDIDDVWGIITGGWTTSNAIAMLLARENYKNSTMLNGVYGQERSYIVIPKWIGHYSIRCSQMRIWLWFNLLEVETNNFCYDLGELKKTLKQYKWKIMALVAYAWDSRTMSVDDFVSIYSLVKNIDPNIWLHADACHGFSLGCSRKLKHKIIGIELFDSITTDPHKVFNIPYVASALLLKTPKVVHSISTPSDLITKEKFSFWQITPFIGSKSWLSLKLRFFMKNLGCAWLEKLIDDRHNIAKLFAAKIEGDKDFVLLNDVNINSVMFVFVGNIKSNLSVDEKIDAINYTNRKIYEYLLEDGMFYLHSVPIPDSGIFQKGATLSVLRFMSWNPILNESVLDSVLNRVKEIWFLISTK